MFFAHSLAIHQAQCAPKMAKQLVACPACGIGVPQAEINAHLNSCKAAREMMGMQEERPKKPRSPSPSARGKSKAATARASSPRSQKKDKEPPPSLPPPPPPLLRAPPAPPWSGCALGAAAP